MPFSILLLTSANSERHITGAKSDRVSMEQNLRSGELVLFFDKVDEGPARAALGMVGQNCCDGIIFYKKNDTQNIICLVEMKHTNLDKAEKQIENTYDRLNFC